MRNRKFIPRNTLNIPTDGIYRPNHIRGECKEILLHKLPDIDRQIRDEIDRIQSDFTKRELSCVSYALFSCDHNHCWACKEKISAYEPHLFANVEDPKGTPHTPMVHFHCQELAIKMGLIVDGNSEIDTLLNFREGIEYFYKELQEIDGIGKYPKHETWIELLDSLLERFGVSKSKSLQDYSLDAKKFKYRD